jgi:hypothetical protein
MVRGITMRPNKELKLTKPSIMGLRSLTPVFDRPRGREERRGW